MYSVYYFYFKEVGDDEKYFAHQEAAVLKRLKTTELNTSLTKLAILNLECFQNLFVQIFLE